MPLNQSPGPQPMSSDRMAHGLKELKLASWFATQAPDGTVLIADQELVDAIGIEPTQRTSIISASDLASTGGQHKVKNAHLVVATDRLNEKKAIQRARNFVGDAPVLGLVADVCQTLSLGVSSDKSLAQIDMIELPLRSYAVLCTARSGSTWFCHLLQNTGLLGHPTEHLRPPAIFMARHAVLSGFSLSLWCDRLMRARQKHGVFATKVIDDFLDDMSDASLTGETAILDRQTAATRLIHFEREDKVAQAVSKFMAMRTKIWHLRQQERADDYRARKAEIAYDGPALKAVHDCLVSNEDRYRSFLKTQSRPTLHLTYEAALADPQAAVRAVAAFVLDDVPEELPLIHERYFPMTDEINARFARQLRCDYGI